jgi:tRNA modification GTPase
VARSGAVVVLAGPPNAGKSSLFNALVGEARAIVSDEAGTTRDAIEVFLDTEPWPIRLVDTAGLRSETSVVERLGIEVSERFLRAADIILACAESVGASTETVARIRELTSARVIAVLTKADMQHGAAAEDGMITVSARLGLGLDSLQARIAHEVTELAGHSGDDRSMVSSARQVASLRGAATEVSLFQRAWEAAELPTPVVATHLRAAITALDDLIGAVDSDDVLARVFANFCIGK